MCTVSAVFFVPALGSVCCVRVCGSVLFLVIGAYMSVAVFDALISQRIFIARPL